MNEVKIIQYYTGCKQIFDHYGIENQKKQFIQELAELIQAITKNDRANFIEELADVQVMIDQFTITSKQTNTELQRIGFEKVQRQLKRIEKEKK